MEEEAKSAAKERMGKKEEASRFTVEPLDDEHIASVGRERLQVCNLGLVPFGALRKFDNGLDDS